MHPILGESFTRGRLAVIPWVIRGKAWTHRVVPSQETRIGFEPRVSCRGARQSALHRSPPGCSPLVNCLPGVVGLNLSVLSRVVAERFHGVTLFIITAARKEAIFQQRACKTVHRKSRVQVRSRWEGTRESSRPLSPRPYEAKSSIWTPIGPPHPGVMPSIESIVFTASRDPIISELTVVRPTVCTKRTDLPSSLL